LESTCDFQASKSKLTISKVVRYHFWFFIKNKGGDKEIDFAG
jgi:hypothetical protein